MPVVSTLRKAEAAISVAVGAQPKTKRRTAAEADVRPFLAILAIWKAIAAADDDLLCVECVFSLDWCPPVLRGGGGALRP